MILYLRRLYRRYFLFALFLLTARHTVANGGRRGRAQVKGTEPTAVTHTEYPRIIRWRWFL